MIHKIPILRSVVDWILRKAAIPKFWTISMCATYILLFIGWVPAIINPPTTLTGVWGLIVMYMVASLVLVGSFTGVFSAFWGVFRVEKWSVLTVASGIIMYYLVVQGLHWTSEGNRLPQAQTIGALIPTFIARFVWVTSKGKADAEELLISKRYSD